MNRFRLEELVSMKTDRNLLRRRLGSTLVELVVALGVASGILATCLATIHFLLSAERESVQSAYRITTLNRLSRSFRSDIHSAASATIERAEGSAGNLILTLPKSGKIAYAIEKQKLIRTADDGNGQLHRDEFRLPIGATCRFEKTAGPERVRLVVGTPRRPSRSLTSNKSTATNSADHAIVTLEAVAGRDLRFEGAR
ncbi:MAG: type II secretion system protein J [Planctomycetaceae bacterium]